MNNTGVPQIEAFALGPFATNCYLVHVPPDPTCWIIDASFSPGPIIDRVRQLGLTPTHVILTHAHGDHIAGLNDVRAAFPGIQVLIHRAEADFLADPVLNLSAGFGPPVTCDPADGLLEGGETLNLAGSSWEVLNTPGHSPGGITLYCKQAHTAIVGDCLFAGSVGRFDFPTSNERDLMHSIRNVLYKLPAETRVFAGHGPATSIGREMTTNPYVRA